ncbi:MAG: hypothetical protein Q8R08_04095 [bacterium]|nr:hypothetical protein [bacterium]
MHGFYQAIQNEMSNQFFGWTLSDWPTIVKVEGRKGPNLELLPPCTLASAALYLANLALVLRRDTASSVLVKWGLDMDVTKDVVLVVDPLPEREFTVEIWSRPMPVLIPTYAVLMMTFSDSSRSAA